MALFVDGPVATVDLLTDYDSNVLAVSASERINLTTKLMLAHDAMYLELVRLMRRSEFYTERYLWIPHRGIENVIWSKALEIWQVYQGLALVYRDAYYSQVNDRHQARAAEYSVLANTARRELIESGLGLAASPLRRPSQPIVSLLPASEVGGTFYFSISYTNDQNQESSGSVILAVNMADGNAADLTLGLPPVPNATGWNLYAGPAPDQMFRQNDSPLVLTSDWAYLPSLALTSGFGLPTGQTADQHWPLHRFLQRG